MKFNKKTIYLILAIIFIRLFSVSIACGESKRKKIREGNKYFINENYDASIEKFSEALLDEPESDVINYDVGTVYYKKGEYLKAVEHLQKSLLTEDDELRQKVFYNMGNAMYKAGIEHENSDINGAVNALEQSLNSIESSLALDQEDDDAKYNYDFVKKELERLRKIQKKEEQKCDNPKDSKDGSENDKDQTEKDSKDKQDSKSKQQQNDESQDSQDSKDQEAQEGSEQKDSSKEDEKEEDQGYNSSQDSQEGEPEHQRAGEKQQSGELSRKEAQMLIENYRQTEEPQGLLNVFKGQATDRGVLKDW